MKKFLSIILLFIVVITAFQNCATTNNTSIYQAIPNEDINNNILAAYGQKIYTRESCNQCHTQHLKKQTNQLISLDGLGGKYSNNWLFHYLDQPRMVIYNAKMPAYSKLTKTQLNKTVVSKIAKENHLETNPDKLWENLMEEANTIHKTLDTPEAIKNTEILALIAYLNQIPISNYFKKIIRIEQKQLDKEVSVWDKVSFDKNSILLKTANNEASIELGKRLFSNNCIVCHRQNGAGGIGPNLTDNYWLHGGSKLDIAKTITFGVAGKGMISWKSMLNPDEIGQLTAYVYSLKGTNPENPKEPQGIKE